MTDSDIFNEAFETDIELSGNHDNPSPSSVRRRSSERAFGSIIGSKSIKPVHLANVIFSHITGETTDMSGFKEFVKDGKTDHEDNPASDWISGTPSDDKFNTLQNAMHLVYHNDRGFYTDSSNAPTCTSTRLLDRSTGFITIGRFVYEMLNCADGTQSATSLLDDELQDNTDGLSLLARPALQSADTRSRATNFTEKTLDDPFEDEKAAHAVSVGFRNLSSHFERAQPSVDQAVSDLRFTVKLGGFGLYVYLLNRHEELQKELTESDDDADVPDRGRFPIVLNYSARDNRGNNILQSSYDSYERGRKEVQKAAMLGCRAQLNHITLDYEEISDGLSDEQGETLISEVTSENGGDSADDVDEIPLMDLSNATIQELIEEQVFPIVSPDSTSDDFQRFAARFGTRTADTLEQRCIEAYRFAIRRDSFASSEVYPIKGGVRNLIRRLGLLKPFGPWAKHRWFRPDPDLLAPIVLSVISEDEGEVGVELTTVCERLLERYGIVVGGTENDRAHLRKWEISFGSDPEYEATFDYNYEQFKRELISLGYAQEYSDGVTYVYSHPFLQQ